MPFWKRWIATLSRKAFTWNQMSGITSLGAPVWSANIDYRTLIREGLGNPVLYACLVEIMRAAGSVHWQLKRRASTTKGTPQPVADDDPAWGTLRRANPWQSGAAFREATTAFYVLTGNAFITRVSDTKRGKEIPHELYNLIPDRARFRPLHDALHQPVGYAYKQFTSTGSPLPDRLYSLPNLPENGLLIYQGTPREPDAPLLHLKQFTPTDDWFGLGPMSAAAHSTDNLNAALAWNTSLLQQSCRPPLSLTSDGAPSPEEKIVLREQLEDMFSGPNGAGKPLLLWGGMKATAIGMNPQEMEWLKGSEAAGLDICRVFNVAPELVGFPGAKTYASYTTARKALYTETVFPILDMIAEELTHWLLPLYDDSLYLTIDRDNVDAIREERAQLFQQLSHVGAWWMTPNQKLTMVGLPTIGVQGDTLWIPGNYQPMPELPEPGAALPADEGKGLGLEELMALNGRNGHARKA